MKSIKFILIVYITMFIGCSFDLKKPKHKTTVFKCNNETLFELEKIKIKKQDTLNYEEGYIYNITTNDNSSILAVCGGNALLSHPKNYILIDSSHVEGALNLFGINSENGLYWRKYKNLMYSNVQAKDTLEYNKIIR